MNGDDMGHAPPLELFMRRNSVCPCSAILCVLLAIPALGQTASVKGTSTDGQGVQQKGKTNVEKYRSKVTIVNKKLEAAAEMMRAHPPNYDQAIATLTEATQIVPREDVAWYRLGLAYLESAKAQSETAESTRRSSEAYNDFENAIALYKRNSKSQRRGSSDQGGGLGMSRLNSQPSRVTGGLGLAKAEAPPDNHRLAVYYDSLGDAASNLEKNDEAVKDFQQAVQLDPAYAATYYFNMGIILRNKAKTVDEKKQAVDAFDKSIAADPNKAPAYYLKGEVLFGMATTDSEGKVIAPPGTVEALQKYLELQPNSPYAEQAKSFLAVLNAPIEGDANKGTVTK